MLKAKVMKNMFEAQLNSGCGQIAAAWILPHAQMREGGRDGGQKAVIAMDSGAKRMRISQKSSFFSEICFLPVFRCNLLPSNPLQRKQTGGILGFFENFSGVYMGGRGARKGQMLKAKC